MLLEIIAYIVLDSL